MVVTFCCVWVGVLGCSPQYTSPPIASHWIGDQTLTPGLSEPVRNEFEVTVELDLQSLAHRTPLARNPKRLQFEWTLAGLGQWSTGDETPLSVLALTVDAPDQQVSRDLVLAPQAHVGLRLRDRFNAGDGPCDAIRCRRRYRVRAHWFHASTSNPPPTQPLYVRWVVAGNMRRGDRVSALVPGDFRVSVTPLTGEIHAQTTSVPFEPAADPLSSPDVSEVVP